MKAVVRASWALFACMLLACGSEASKESSAEPDAGTRSSFDAGSDFVDPSLEGAMPRLVEERDLNASDASNALHASACSGAAMPPSPSRPGTFLDVSAEAGLTGLSGESVCGASAIECEARSMAGGVAVGDFDADGYPDFYVTRGRLRDALFLNCRDGTFSDVTDRVGISKADSPSSGALWLDVDRDQDLDLLVTSLGSDARRHYLYIQDQGTFAEDGLDRGVSLFDGTALYGTGIAAADVDRDGYLDLYIGEWRDDKLLPDETLPPNHSRLLLNKGAESPGVFVDVTDTAGLTQGGTHTNGILTADGVFTFTPMFSDLDKDGHIDLAIAADFGSSKLFWNDGKGAFIDGTKDAQVGTDQAGMGADLGDLDGDGRIDWFVTSIYDSKYGWNGNRLYRNLGNRTFEDVSLSAGVRDGGWGWGVALSDFDHDLDLDVFSVSGFRVRGFGGTPGDVGSLRLFERITDNEASGEWFENKAQERLPKAQGEARGLALIDFDKDGDQDALVAYHKGLVTLLRNDLPASGTSYVRVRLFDKNGMAAAGARVTFRDGDTQILRELHLGAGFLGQHEDVLHAGFAAGDTEVRVDVEWPSGALSTFRVMRDTTWLVFEP